jgi:hypothetical protein
VLFALSIGPIIHVSLPALTIPRVRPASGPDPAI